MTPRVRVLPAADRDLDEQADYLAEHGGFEAAHRLYDAADETFSFLARNPGVGVLRASSNPALAGIRVWRVNGFEKRLVYYRPVEDGVEVVRVLHGHRDIDAILGPED